jgi:DNA (cytosine-5)-methyltransferase 1
VQLVASNKVVGLWSERLARSGRDEKPVDCWQNVVTILQGHPEWQQALGADTFAKQIVVRTMTPCGHEPGTLWSEQDHFKLGLWLRAQCGLLIKNPKTIADAVGYAALENPFHPVQDFFSALEWDGKHRWLDWLPKYLGTPLDMYHMLVGQFFLVALVQRVFEPGCIMRAVPVLEGEQETGKSTAVRILGRPWSADTPFHIGNKDTYQLLHGQLIYEINELQAFTRAEAAQVKAFISSPEDYFRAPYDRGPKKHPRHTVFVATTNARQYLKDWTGNTRFWPVRCGEIDLRGLERDRDQLLAEAVMRYQMGEGTFPREAFPAPALCRAAGRARAGPPVGRPDRQLPARIHRAQLHRGRDPGRRLQGRARPHEPQRPGRPARRRDPAAPRLASPPQQQARPPVGIQASAARDPRRPSASRGRMTRTFRCERIVMPAYYNEIEPYAAEWLRLLVAAGHIAPGDVDERSIVEVQPDDLRGYTQCHFFAGIGGWSLALRLAGWPDDRPVWTGSCPCQPFSAAGKQRGSDDERHLWPAFFRLIRECRPGAVFGEQVAGAAGLAWLDHVCADLEGEGYAAAAADLPAASVGAPHGRARLWWVADAGQGRRSIKRAPRLHDHRQPGDDADGCGAHGRVGNADDARLQGREQRGACEQEIGGGTWASLRTR